MVLLEIIRPGRVEGIIRSPEAGRGGCLSSPRDEYQPNLAVWMLLRLAPSDKPAAEGSSVPVTDVILHRRRLDR